MKSRFNLWGPVYIRGKKRWGLDEQRGYKIYTYGPRDGWSTRKEAVAVMRLERAQERRDAGDSKTGG